MKKIRNALIKDGCTLEWLDTLSPGTQVLDTTRSTQVSFTPEHWSGRSQESRRVLGPQAAPTGLNLHNTLQHSPGGSHCSGSSTCPLPHEALVLRTVQYPLRHTDGVAVLPHGSSSGECGKELLLKGHKALVPVHRAGSKQSIVGGDVAQMMFGAAKVQLARQHAPSPSHSSPASTTPSPQVDKRRR